MRRLLLVALSCAMLLAACGSSQSWSGLGTDAHGGPSAPSAATTPASPEAPTDAAPTNAPSAATPTKAAPTKAAPSQAAGAGIDFTPADGSFTVHLPGQPALTTQTYKTAAGDAPTNLWTYQVSADLAYFVAEAAYPAGSMSGQASSAVFDAALNGMVTTTTGAKVTASGSTTRQGHSGRTFSITTPEANLKGLLFIVEDNLYMVYAGYTTAIKDMTPVDSFLASFEFPVIGRGGIAA